MPNFEHRQGADDDVDGAWRRERFRVFYNKHQSDIWRYSLRRATTVDHAEEVFAETFAVAWKQFDRIPTGSQARLWLFGVARNHLRNSWRKRKRRQVLDERIAAEGAQQPPDDPAVVAPSATAHIVAALNGLSAKDREVLQLVAWEDLSHAEIGVVLGCSENAVALRLRRARSRLTKQLAQKDDEQTAIKES